MILYLVKSSLCLGLLLVVYHLFLEREKMHYFNRFYLLFALLFSLTIPLLPVGVFDYLSSWSTSAFTTETQLNQPLPSPAVELDSGHINETSVLASTATLIWTGVIIYGVITFLMLFRLIYKVDSILFKVRRHTRVLYNNVPVVLLKEKTVPFSFFSYIFMNERDYLDKKINTEVLIHESTHVRQKHSFDILFVEILKSLFWFNPLFYYYKRAMQLNHEFLADQAVLTRTNKINAYQKLLLQTIQSDTPVLLTSSFNFSLTKKRFMMMNYKSSRIRLILKKLCILTLIINASLLFGSTVTTVIAQDTEKQSSTIIIEVPDSSEVIKLNGREIHISFLDRMLRSFPDDSEQEQIVSLRVDRKAYTGVVIQVQKILRDISAERINYKTIEAHEEMLVDTVRELFSQFQQEVRKYMQMDVTEFTIEELQSAYNQVMTIYHNYVDAVEESYSNSVKRTPPPPPIPPNPEIRIENSSN